MRPGAVGAKVWLLVYDISVGHSYGGSNRRSTGRGARGGKGREKGQGGTALRGPLGAVPFLNVYPVPPCAPLTTRGSPSGCVQVGVASSGLVSLSIAVIAAA